MLNSLICFGNSINTAKLRFSSSPVLPAQNLNRQTSNEYGFYYKANLDSCHNFPEELDILSLFFFLT